MSTFTLKIMNVRKPDLIVEIDGNRVDTYASKMHYLDAVYTTNESKLHLKIYKKKNELLSRFFFLKFLFYYIISFFGLFDWSYSKDAEELYFECDIDMTQDYNLVLIRNLSQDNGKAFKAQDVELDESIPNKHSFNKKVKMRYGLVLAFKILSWIAILLSIILINIL